MKSINGRNLITQNPIIFHTLRIIAKYLRTIFDIEKLSTIAEFCDKCTLSSTIAAFRYNTASFQRWSFDRSDKGIL